MFRYSAMAQAAKKILKEHNATPLAVIARYACAYSDIRKKDWYAHPIKKTVSHVLQSTRAKGMMALYICDESTA